MDAAALKPLLTVLVLPPVAPLLLSAFALALLMRQTCSVRVQRWARWSVLLGLLLTCLSSMQVMAVALSQRLLPQYAAQSPAALQASGARVLVVLGAGTQPVAPEYGGSLLDLPGRERLRYAQYLRAQTGLPLFYSGGSGWAAFLPADAGAAAMHRALQNTARTDLQPMPDGWEHRSRDTAENASASWAALAPRGQTHIILITHAWHMPRAVQHFKRQGFSVTAAPLAAISRGDAPLRDWLPSGRGAENTYHVLREWLGLRMQGAR